MATTSGSYMFCDADSSFAITLNCEGPNCGLIVGNSSLSCNKTGSDSWQCTNGVTCASASGFTSKFSIAETNTTVVQTQNVSINGTGFTFQQDGAGNVTLSNSTSTTSSSGGSTVTTSLISSTSLPSMVPTNAKSTVSVIPSSATSSTTPSPSVTKTSSAPCRQSYSTMLLLTMLALSLFLTQTQAGPIWTGNDIGAAVGNIFNAFNAAAKGNSLFQTAANAISGKFTEIAVSTCGGLVGEGVGGLVGLPTAYGECEEAMVGAEMSAIGSPLGLTLRTYAGLGGVLTTALTAADEAVVLGADASILPEVFIINSALCGLLIAVIRYKALNPASENLCSAIESAAENHGATSTSSSSSTSTTSSASSKSTSTTAAPVTTASSSSPTPNPSSSLTIPSVAQDQCASCQLSVYAMGIEGLAAACHVATALGTAYDVSTLLCDSSFNGRYSQFCATLCTNPCATYNINSWIQSAGSQYVPSDTLATCSNLCPGFKGDGRCSTTSTCECGIGAGTCNPC
jgi:trimeric autotransporter adhesin